MYNVRVILFSTTPGICDLCNYVVRHIIDMYKTDVILFSTAPLPHKGSMYHKESFREARCDIMTKTATPHGEHYTF
jgi:hypothetical protein